MYMALYVAEFQFRYNNRHNPDIFRGGRSRVLRRTHRQLSQLNEPEYAKGARQLELPFSPPEEGRRR